MGERSGSLNNDELYARRLLAILTQIASSSHGVSTDALYNRHYASMKHETAKKTFKRDIDRLRSFGVIIRKEQIDDVTRWSVDDDTWADACACRESEATALDLRCRALLSDPTFELRDELATGLAKLRGREALRVEAAQTQRGYAASSTTGKLLEACVGSLICNVTYKKATGEVDEREIQPLASFVLRDHTYFVASMPNSDEEPHTYRDDRFVSVKVTARSFERPQGFDVDKYIRLPFQIGKPVGRVTFRQSPQARESLEQLLTERAELSADKRSASVSYSNAREAAAWAVANGLVPIDDQDVINEWKDIVKRSAS